MKTFILASHKGLYLTTLCFLLSAFACSPAPTVIATSAPMEPSLTAAPVPTATVQPSATAQPSATPISSITPTPLATGLGQVIFSENFDHTDFPFNIYGPYRIEGADPHQSGLGVLVMEREEGYQPPPDMWPTDGLYGRTPVAPGETTAILFKVTGAIDFNIGYDTGTYGTDTLRRFSFNSASGTWNLFEGQSPFPIQTWNARKPRSNIWHYFSITRSANGDMDARLWEAGKPETLFQFQGNLGSEWGALPLRFLVDFRWGTFMLDEYQDLQ